MLDLVFNKVKIVIWDKLLSIIYIEEYYDYFYICSAVALI